MPQQLFLLPRPLEIIAYVRKLRGGSQAHLVQAEDGHFYAIKTRNNPQHRRILINEWFATTFYAAAGLPVPDATIVHLSPRALAQFPQLRFEGRSNALPSTGCCFGSRWVGDPHKLDTYEFLPPDLMQRVDPGPFVGCLVVDQWFCQSDTRQAVFRVTNRKPQASFIDHGYIWSSPEWDLSVQFPSFYPVRQIYSQLTDSTVAEWIDSLRKLRVDQLFQTASQTMPSEWLEDGEERLLKQLRIRLVDRLKHLHTHMDWALAKLRQ